jgi:phage gp29-like protein
MKMGTTVADKTGVLIDESGKVISSTYIASLRDEISPVDATVGRPPFSGHLAYGMDPVRLGTIMRASDNGSSLDWMILAEEIEELFPHYYSVLSKRKRQVVQLPVTIEPAGDDPESQKHAELVQNWIDDGVLADAMMDMFDAIGKGYSVHEILWSTEPGRVVPKEFCYRPQRFFELSWKDGSTLWLRGEAGFIDLQPHKFVVHRHRSKSGTIMRGGLTRIIAFLWMFSAFTLRDWALFCQAYGMPIRIGRYGPEASETDKRVLWRAVSSIAGDVAAIIPKSMEMEFVKDSERTAGSTLYEKRADWLNREVSKVVLGGTAGTEAIHGGHAVGQEHRAAEQDVERFDAGLLSTTLTRQVVHAMVAFTYGPQKKYPKLLIGRPDEVPLKDVIAGVADLAPIGLKVKASEIRERLGLSKPEEGDEVIGGPPEPVEKTPVPSLAVTPPELQQQLGRQPWLSQLITKHSEAPPELVEAMVARLEQDAAGAMGGMIEIVRAQFEQATDMQDLVHRLSALKLPADEFAEAMSRGMALANLVGQADVVSDLVSRTAIERHAALSSSVRDRLPDDDFAVPGKRALPIHDAAHVRLAWDMVRRTAGLTAEEKAEARRRIRAKARKLDIDTSAWGE